MDIESRRELESEFFMALGKFTYQFSILEDVMKVFAGMLINVNNEDIGRIMTSSTSFQPLYHSLMSLYRSQETEQSLVTEFEKLLDETYKLNEKRNNLIHSIWDVGVTSDSIKRTKRTARFSKGLQMEVETYQVDDINELTDQLIEATQALFMFSFNWQVKHPSESFKKYLDILISLKP
jgi:hypothetical protein